MNSSRHFVFKSSMFPPESGEDSETNPGLFGKALAAWLAARLGNSGYAVDGEVAEDFGRLVKLKHSRFKAYVACCSTDESAVEWRVFGIVEGGGLFAKSEKAALLEKIAADVESILRKDSGIADLRVEHA
jgi:hypothetical protein